MFNSTLRYYIGAVGIFTFATAVYFDLPEAGIVSAFSSLSLAISCREPLWIPTPWAFALVGTYSTVSHCVMGDLLAGAAAALISLFAIIFTLILINHHASAARAVSQLTPDTDQTVSSHDHKP